MWSHIFSGFLLFSLVYLLLCYSLRWYELTNRPEYFLRRTQPGAPRRRFAGAAIKNFAIEYFYTIIHMLLLFADYLCFPISYILKQGKSPHPDDRRYVILIHGFMMRGNVMRWIKLKLNRAGWRNVYVFHYGPPWQDIPHFSRQLKAFIDDLALGEPDIRFDLVCHSMGGLVARHYIHQLDGARRIQRLITLGTPHQGSKLWGFALSNSAVQMCPQNPWLTNLAQYQPETYKLTCIYSNFDELVVPNENAMSPVPGAVNIPLDDVGHVGLLFDPQAIALVGKALRE